MVELNLWQKYIKGKPCKPYNSTLGEFFRVSLATLLLNYGQVYACVLVANLFVFEISSASGKLRTPPLEFPFPSAQAVKVGLLLLMMVVKSRSRYAT